MNVTDDRVAVSGSGRVTFMFSDVPAENIPKEYEGDMYALNLPRTGFSAGSKGKPYYRSESEFTPRSNTSARMIFSIINN